MATRKQECEIWYGSIMTSYRCIKQMNNYLTLVEISKIISIVINHFMVTPEVVHIIISEATSFEKDIWGNISANRVMNIVSKYEDYDFIGK